MNFPEITEAYQSLSSLLAQLDDNALRKEVKDLLDRQRPHMFYPRARISLCGKFNAGKSSLINAIVGNKVVLARPVPSTGVVTRLFRNPLPEYCLIRKVGDGEQVEQFDASLLDRFSLKDNSNNNRDVKDVLRVDIGLPGILDEDIELFDTPGLEDDGMMNETTLSHLDNSDFIVFVIDALQLIDLKSLLMRYYCRLGRNVVFVANKIDTVEEDEFTQIKERAQMCYGDYYNPITFNSEIFLLSAKSSEGDTDRLFHFLQEQITPNAKKVAQVSRLSILLDEIGLIYERYKEKILVCENREQKYELQRNKSALSQKIIELQTMITNLQILLNDDYYSRFKQTDKAACRVIRN